MTITKQDVEIFYNLIESSSISGKSVEVVSELKGRLLDFLKSTPEAVVVEETAE